MKPSVCLPFALLLGLTSLLPAQETNRWDLFTSMDWTGRLAYLADPAQAPFDEPFTRQVLDLSDQNRIETGTDTEVAQKRSVAVWAIRALASLPSSAAIPAIARIPAQYKDPFLRGEAWLALGRLGDQTSIPSMDRTLEALNNSGLRSRGEEIEAAYLVQALGLLKAEGAFRTVAAASLAWYAPASQVRALARKVLPTLVADTEAATLKVLADDEDLTLKEGLFQAVTDQGDLALSGRAAAAVLSTLVRFQPRDASDQDRAGRLTLAALLAAQKSPSPPPSLVPSLKVLLVRAESLESQVQAVRLLGKVADPAAVALLTTTLSTFNGLQKSRALAARNLVLVKELFQALGATGKVEARTALSEARFSDYTPAFVREAEAALAKLPK